MRLTSKEKEVLKKQMINEMLEGVENEHYELSDVVEIDETPQELLEQEKEMLECLDYEEVRELHNTYFDIELGINSNKTAINIQECVEGWQLSVQ